MKCLIEEDPREQVEIATELILNAMGRGRLIAPSFCRLEVGSLLRKKARQSAIPDHGLDEIWDRFAHLPIEFGDTPQMYYRAWQIAAEYSLPTLYDAAFLACAEAWLPSANVEFWTADQVLLGQLSISMPEYVRRLENA